LAGVLLLVAELLELLPAFDDYPFSELALTGLFTFQVTLYLLGLILLSVGLVGLYTHRSDRAGLLGLVGFLIAFIGTVFFTGFFWAHLFVAPALAVGRPNSSIRAAVSPGSACRFSSTRSAGSCLDSPR
jgi:apolipoprotein N-acyltransferase